MKAIHDFFDDGVFLEEASRRAKKILDDSQISEKTMLELTETQRLKDQMEACKQKAQVTYKNFSSEMILQKFQTYDELMKEVLKLGHEINNTPTLA